MKKSKSKSKFKSKNKGNYSKTGGYTRAQIKMVEKKYGYGRFPIDPDCPRIISEVFNTVDLKNSWLEPIDIYSLYAGTEKQIKLADNWFKKNPQAKTYWDKGLWYHHDEKKMSDRYEESIEVQTTSKCKTGFNSMIREVVAKYGLNSGIFKHADTFIENENIKELKPISKKFFDTFIVQNRRDFDNLSNLRNEFQSHFRKLPKKFLQHVNQGYLCHVANENPNKLSEFLLSKWDDIYVVNCDYTQDFAGCLNTSEDDVFNYCKTFYDDRGLQLIKMDRTHIPTLIKGSFIFPHNGKTHKIRFKIYDKLHSIFNNAGFNSVGMTVFKAFLEPRERHLYRFFHNRKKLKNNSVIRLEVTLDSPELLSVKDQVLDLLYYFAHPLIREGDIEKWGNQYFLNTIPQVVVDCSTIEIKEVSESVKWLFKQHTTEIPQDDSSISESIKSSNNVYRGKIFVCYWIEGHPSKLENKDFNFSKSSMCGVFVNTLDDAKQRCIGSRPIAVVKMKKDYSVGSVEYYGVQKTFKPVPSEGSCTNYHGRGFDMDIPKLFNPTYPFSTGSKNIELRTCKPLTRNSVLENYNNFCSEDDLERYWDWLENVQKPKVKLIRENPLKEWATKHLDEIPKLYPNKKHGYLYELIDYYDGIRVYPFCLIKTKSGAIYRLDTKAPDNFGVASDEYTGRKPKYFDSRTNRFRMNR